MSHERELLKSKAKEATWYVPNLPVEALQPGTLVTDASNHARPWNLATWFYLGNIHGGLKKAK